MKSKIIVIGDTPLVTGFGLAGLEDTLIVNDSGFQIALESTIEKKEYGIIVVNEKMFSQIDWRLKKKLDSIAYPVVIPIQDIKNQASNEGEEIKNLIKRALGFDISKK